MSEEAATESGDDPDLDPDCSPDLSQQFTFASGTGPKFIFKKVQKWSVKDWGKSSRGSIGWFLQYCWAFCESEEEEDEMFVWMLSLIALYVREDGWGGFCQGALTWDWSQVALRDYWEIPAPEWARNREEEDIMNGLVETGDDEVGVKKNSVKGDVVKEDEVMEEVKEGEVKEDEMKEEVKEGDVKEDDMEEEVEENEVKKDAGVSILHSKGRNLP